MWQRKAACLAGRHSRVMATMQQRRQPCTTPHTNPKAATSHHTALHLNAPRHTTPTPHIATPKLLHHTHTNTHTPPHPSLLPCVYEEELQAPPCQQHGVGALAVPARVAVAQGHVKLRGGAAGRGGGEGAEAVVMAMMAAVVVDKYWVAGVASRGGISC